MSKMSIRCRMTLLTLFVFIIMACILTGVSVLSSERIYSEAFTNSGAADYWDESSPGDNSAQATEAFSMEDAALQFQLLSILLMIATLIAGGIAAWFVLGIALRPISRLTDQVEQITAHHLDTRITDFQTGDELSRLADAFNHTMERLELTFSAQQQFSTAAAHELKTPLATIKTNIDVLTVGSTTSLEEYDAVFAAVQRQTERMTQLVEDLFLISSSDSYVLTDRINLNEMTNEILQEQSMGSIVPCLQPGPSIFVQGNAAMLHRALSNLVENALKYNRPDGKVTLSIQSENHWAVLTVQDTGVGIAPEHLSRIFDPFYRVDRSRSRKIGGSGLGLAIARDTIIRHDGILTVDSTPGAGTCFTVKIPLLL